MKNKNQSITLEEYQYSVNRLNIIKKQEEEFLETYNSSNQQLNIPRNLPQSLEIELLYLQRKNLDIDTQIELEVQKFIMNFEPNKRLCELLKNKLYIIIELMDNHALTDSSNQPDLELITIINNYPQIEITLDNIRELIKQKHKNNHNSQYIYELLEEKTHLTIQKNRYERTASKPEKTKQRLKIKKK